MCTTTRSHGTHTMSSRSNSIAQWTEENEEEREGRAKADLLRGGGQSAVCVVGRITAAAAKLFLIERRTKCRIPCC